MEMLTEGLMMLVGAIACALAVKLYSWLAKTTDLKALQLNQAQQDAVLKIAHAVIKTARGSSKEVNPKDLLETLLHDKDLIPKQIKKMATVIRQSDEKLSNTISQADIEVR